MYDDKHPTEIPDHGLEPARQRALEQCASCAVESNDCYERGMVQNGRQHAREAAVQGQRAKDITNEIMRRARLMWDEIHNK